METVKAVPDPTPDPKKGKRRARSGVKFPYYDLDDAITVARTIHEKAGGGCELDQLASWLDHESINSGAFRLRVSATKMFGLIEKSGGKLRVSKRGTAIVAPVDDAQAAKAKVDAFLSVELFRKVYERFKGMTLPQIAGLQNLAREEYKVVPARVEDAVRVMLNAAEQAGFFKATGDRTKMVSPAVAPGVASSPPPAQESQTTQNQNDNDRRNGGGGGNGGNGDTPGVDPFLLEFLKKLPKGGTPISAKRRETLITLFGSAMDVVYPDKDDE